MSMFKSSRARLLAVELLITALVGGVGGWVLSQSSGQDIQAVLYNDAVRFKVQSQDVATIRAEIFDLGGQRLFDSGPKPGNTLDWAMTTEGGERVPHGVYLSSAQCFSDVALQDLTPK